MSCLLPGMLVLFLSFCIQNVLWFHLLKEAFFGHFPSWFHATLMCSPIILYWFPKCVDFFHLQKVNLSPYWISYFSLYSNIAHYMNSINVGFKKLKEGKKGREEERREWKKKLTPYIPRTFCILDKEILLSHDIARNNYTALMTEHKALSIEGNQKLFAALIYWLNKWYLCT